MITGNFKGFKGITQEIYGEVTANLPLYRMRCSCGHAGCLVRHGYYSRRLKTRQGTIVLRILRVKCRECGRTHAILPEIVVPYSQIPADLQQWMLLYPLGSPELESLMQANSDISESNVLVVRSRYRRNWKERLLTMGMNTPYFLARAGAIGPNTRSLIQRVIEKFAYPVQSYRSCFGILRFAEKYGKEALENCCRDALLYGKCSYNYIHNTISVYAHPGKDEFDRMANSLKPADESLAVTGLYKDDDSLYSLDNLLKRQKEGEFQ